MARRKGIDIWALALGIGLLLYPLWTFERARLLHWIVVIGIAAGVLVIVAIVRLSMRSPRSLPSPKPASTKTRSTHYFDGGVQKRPEAWSLGLLHQIEWRRFEELCAGYWRAKDWRAVTTGLGADGGVDIFLYRQGQYSDKALGVIQCKAWSRHLVGVGPVRELYGVKAAEDAPLAVFMTSGDYTEEAKAFAAGKHLGLITGEKLVQLLKQLPEPAGSRLLRNITAGDYTTPSCPHCGIKMARRRSYRRNQEFWGCRNYPRCKQTLHIAGQR